jgi:predicted RNA-binding Zn-ribbon protein involved in translation (DUF1610 family)
MKPTAGGESPRFQCPGCGSLQTRRSKTLKALDFLFLLLTFHPYRCICEHRFYASKHLPTMRPSA